jgi:arsenite methyltransferase
MQLIKKILPTALLCTALVGCGSFKRFGYEGFDRDEWQHPERVVRELSIEPGMQVADIGAGGGYFTFKLADAVGETGRVYAVDVDDDMISYLEERAREEGYENVTVVRGEFEDPLLPDGKLDLVFSSNTYHHIEGRVAYFRKVLEDLAPGGQVAIVDLREGPWLAPSHYTDRDVIVKEMTEAGYTEVASFDFIEAQSFTIFARAGRR